VLSGFGGSTVPPTTLAVPAASGAQYYPQQHSFGAQQANADAGAAAAAQQQQVAGAVAGNIAGLIECLNRGQVGDCSSELTSEAILQLMQQMQLQRQAIA
jgi:hypothetical protein